MKSISLIEIEQPVGSFYLGKISSQDLLNVYEIGRLRDGQGPQRDANKEKIKKIDRYCKTDDRVIFPTPIIVNIKSSSNISLENISENIWNLTYNETSTKFRVIDGQHRLLGVKSSGINIDFPIVIMFDLSPEDEAYIFTTINHNQTKVDKSQIYELFELNEQRSPEKVCHNIARIMNSSDTSPFFKKIKMLGKKANPTETLSQAAFIDGIISFFPKDGTETALFNSFYSEEQDDIILKILTNYFSAVKKVFPEKWADNSANLTKTTGYLALCKAFPQIYAAGIQSKNLSLSFFENHFEKVKSVFCKNNYRFDSDTFPSGAKGQSKLAKVFLLQNAE